MVARKKNRVEDWDCFPFWRVWRKSSRGDMFTPKNLPEREQNITKTQKWNTIKVKCSFNLFLLSFPLSALAASGGQLPLSSLEGGSKVMLGASGGQGGGLPSSLFLNHPALLHMGQNPGAGLISAAVAKASQSSPFPSASSISPTPCSPSPCSSPASSCSSSEMAHSPPSLGGAKFEWPRQGPIREEEEGGNGNLAFHTKAISFSLLRSSSVIFFAMALSLFLSQSFDAKNTQNERGEREGKKWKRGEGGKEEDWNQKSLSIQTDGEEATWDLFVNNTWYRHEPLSLKENKPTTL